MSVNPHSLEWLAVRKIADKQITQAQDLLETATEPSEVYRLQGRIRGLRALISLIEDPT